MYNTCIHVHVHVYPRPIVQCGVWRPLFTFKTYIHVHVHVYVFKTLIITVHVRTSHRMPISYMYIYRKLKSKCFQARETGRAGHLLIVGHSYSLCLILNPPADLASPLSLFSSIHSNYTIC